LRENFDMKAFYKPNTYDNASKKDLYR